MAYVVDDVLVVLVVDVVDLHPINSQVSASKGQNCNHGNLIMSTKVKRGMKINDREYVCICNRHRS
jgi:hypothetical protein